MRALSLEIPPGTPGISEDARRAINERLRRIEEQIGAPLELDADLDAAGFRILNLGDPRIGSDAISQAAADRRYLGQARTSSATQTGVGGSSSSTPNGATADAATMLILAVPGTLSVRSNAAPLLTLPKARNVAAVVALVKRAPTNQDLKWDIMAGAAKWASLTMTKDSTSVTLVTGLAALPADTPITLDITQVGTVFPGADLTVMIRFA